MNILTESERFSTEELVKIEAHYEAKFVCESCLKSRNGGWVNQSVSIFYQPDPAKVPKGGSQWFGLFFRAEYTSPDEALKVPMRVVICNAISATENDIVGIVADNGDVIYSRFRHDYRWSPDKSVMIDGGRDYTRTSTCPNGMVTMRIVEDKLTIMEDDHG